MDTQLQALKFIQNNRNAISCIYKRHVGKVKVDSSHLSIFIVWTKATTSSFVEEVAILCIDMYGQATCPLSKLEMLFPIFTFPSHPGL